MVAGRRHFSFWGTLAVSAILDLSEAALEHFRNIRRLHESSERWLFLGEKAT
jgi:hypothetical protein